jgi:hypothetical protein
LKVEGELDMQLVKIIEKLVDYCDDTLIEQKMLTPSRKGKLTQRTSAQYAPSLKRIEFIGKSPVTVSSASVKKLKN